MVLQLVHSLGEAMVYPDPGNFRTNRKLWCVSGRRSSDSIERGRARFKTRVVRRDEYAKDWASDKDWVVRMAHGSHSEGAEELRFVGDEWSPAADLARVVHEFIEPFVSAESCAGEIGSGGGRVAAQVCPLVERLHCFDVSTAMLAKARTALTTHKNASFTLLDEPRFAPELAETFDFLYAFDVFVHLDLHLMFAYLKEMRRVIKPDGKIFISTANLLAEGGWRRFEAQSKPSVGGFYFVCPEIVRTLLARAGFRVIKEAAPDPDNVYYNRDFLVVAEVAG